MSAREWEVRGLYAGAWEAIYTADEPDDALARLNEYRRNESGTAFRIVKVRVSA